MVTIASYEKKKNQKNEEFIVLNLVSDVVMERSEHTGNWYANTYKANIVASFDEDTAKLMVGKQLPGSIIKKEVAPYEYTVKSTGKKMILKHSYLYVESGVDVYDEEPTDLDHIFGNPTE